MASPPGDGVIAELVFERHVHRAREVAPLVGGTPVRLGQLPAHVEDGQRLAGGQALRQFRRGDQYIVAGHAHATIVPLRLIP